jgi:hypothetical protein
MRTIKPSGSRVDSSTKLATANTSILGFMGFAPLVGDDALRVTTKGSGPASSQQAAA